MELFIEAESAFYAKIALFSFINHTVYLFNITTRSGISFFLQRMAYLSIKEQQDHQYPQQLTF